MSAPKFGPGDMIFAKVRGYPPWPARVEGVADETPNKVKYHVYFFGTNETAVCKQEELFPYVENRAKYGKPMKKKGFNEALAQIDAELGLSPGAYPPQTPNNDTGSEMETSYTDNASGKKSKSSANTPVTTKNKGIRRKAEISDTEQSTSKQRKKSSLADQDMGGDSQESSTSESKLTVSKSGRKIKPKKFLDGSDDGEEDSATPKNKGQGSKTPSQTTKSNQIASKDQLQQLDAEFLKDGTLVAFTPKGEEVRLKLNLNKPDSVKSEKAKIEWEATLLERAREIREKIESGTILPENVKKEIHEKYQDKLIEIETKMGRDDKKETLEFLKTEARLLDLDVQIKSSLNLKQAQPESALKYMDDFLKVNITPLMLKKHPEIVDTVKKLRKYVGNASSWDITEDTAVAFAAKAAKIRAKAETLYNKIKSLFLVPSGESFWDIFGKELKDFNEAVKGMTPVSVYQLIKDPVNQPLDKNGAQNEDQEENENNTSTSAA